MSQKKSIFNAAPRYAVVVGVGFAVDYGVFSAAYTLGLSIYVSNLFGFLVGGITNVVLIRRYVFTNSRFSLMTDLAATAVSNGVLFVLGSVLLWVFVEMLSINPYLAKLLANGITFAGNFFTRAFLFRIRPHVL